VSTPTIAIVGAGPGGLVLARVLRGAGLPATVYELDAGPTARDQGGTLDLHEESGQLAMRAAGLDAEFRRLARYEGEATRVLDRHGAVVFDEPADEAGGTRPEVDRTALRDTLLASLEPDAIAWGHKVTAVRTAADGRHELTFADGATVRADLLVGADGAWSKVRPLLSDATPEYTGVSFVEMRLTDADRTHPAAAALVGAGSMFALSDGEGLIAQRNGDGGIRVYAAFRTPENWLSDIGVDWADPVAARTALLRRFAGWSADLTALIRDCDDGFVPRPIHALPIGHAWDRRPGVTLLGDAAHLMSPFAGEGANLAMLDAAELGRALAAHRGDVEKALAQYESAMFPRSAAAAAASAEGIEICFAADAPHGFAALMAGHRAEG
jgi:2-polyprenyl-6-methoxyphenol hydroxylase-like FAD-dependent oxidoreductase